MTHNHIHNFTHRTVTGSFGKLRGLAVGCCSCGLSEPIAKLLGADMKVAETPVTWLPLTALRAFDMAAQKGSFALAAAALGVTPAAVSQQIKRLEQRLGATLFFRGNRRVTLTDAGRRLHGQVQPAMQQLEEAVDRAALGGRRAA